MKAELFIPSTTNNDHFDGKIRMNRGGNATITRMVKDIKETIGTDHIFDPDGYEGKVKIANKIITVRSVDQVNWMFV